MVRRHWRRLRCQRVNQMKTEFLQAWKHSYQFGFGGVHLHGPPAVQSSIWDERWSVLEIRYQTQKSDKANWNPIGVCLVWGLPSRPSWWAWRGAACSERHGPSCPSSWCWRGGPGAGHRPEQTPEGDLNQWGDRGVWKSPVLTSVLTCMTPSSVRVLVSMTGTPSVIRSAKIFWKQEHTDMSLLPRFPFPAVSTEISPGSPQLAHWSSSRHICWQQWSEAAGQKH